MQEVLGDMMGGFHVPGPDPGQPTLYVATMESMNHGAGVLAYPGFLDEACKWSFQGDSSATLTGQRMPCSWASPSAGPQAG